MTSSEKRTTTNRLDDTETRGRDRSSARKADVTTWRTIPNYIGVTRLILSPLLILLAARDLRYGFVALYFVLGLSDWIDGLLARMLKQRSALGARIDSVADAVLNICMIVGVWLLARDMVLEEMPWFVVACVSYAAACLLGMWKYGRLPAWHTMTAKLTHLLVFVAVICAIMEWSIWPLRIAAISAIIANLESMALTSVVKRWRADVPSLFSVWPLRS